MYLKNRLPKFVKKKDGTMEKFQRKKIETSITKTLRHAGK